MKLLPSCFCLWCVVLLGFFVSATGAQTDDAPVPIYAKGEKEFEVQCIRRIWSEGPHNAFPDVAYFQGQWYVALREGTAHGISGFGRVRIITSQDGSAWQSVALFDDFGDYRGPKLSITPDNRLMVISKFNRYGKPSDGGSRLFQARNHAGKEYKVTLTGVENRVAFSQDGRRWGTMQAVRGTCPQAWFYSGVRWFRGVGYAIDRQGQQLYRTRDGLHFEKVSEVPVGNESRLTFLTDGTMLVLFRNGCLASSQPPYTQWKLNEKNKRGPHDFAGPNILALPNGMVLAASRHHIQPAAFHFPAGQPVFPESTVLFKLQGDTLVPKLLLRGGGDSGYNGMIWHDSHLWLVYNSPSRKAGKSCIYFAQIKLTTH